MKVLLIYLENSKLIVDIIRPLLEKVGITVETLLLKHPEETDIGQFTAFFGVSGPLGHPLLEEGQNKAGIPSHVLILSSLPRRWIDFLAGFSYGSKLPVIIYGQDAITGMSQDFASFFSFLNADTSLQSYFEAENEALKKQEAARGIIKAQETLLGMGIPVTGESLAQCAGEGRLREVALFLAAGFSPATRNKTGVPLLNIAARNGQQEITRYLIMAGAELNLKADDRGTSALIDSVQGKHYDLMTDLVKAGADLNLKSKDGQTALIVAVGIGEEKMVETLARAGANPDISDNLGASARKYAALFSNKTMLALFDAYAPQKKE